MLAAEHSPTAPALPRTPHSAGDLCRAMQTAAGVGCRPDPAGLDRVLFHDVAHCLVEVQAGASWGSLAGLIGSELMAGTVGAGVAANRPGPDGRPLIAHVRALTLASADGVLRRASRDRSAELFALAIGGFGAFGPFYSITLDLRSLAQAAAARMPNGQTVEAQSAAGAPRFEVELLLPPQAESAAVRGARALVEEHRFSLELLEVRRMLSESESFLRWARREYAALRIAFRTHATLGAAVSAAQLRARLIDLAICSGGAFMPAELPRASRSQIEACYPMLPAFLAEKRRLDPGERIINPWYRDTSRSWRGEACRVRWSRT